MQPQEHHIQVLSGTIRNLRVENTTADVFFRTGDQEGMAATGILAAAMGLSGIAAGMAGMSMEETREPICKASFDLDGKHVDALLWNWPFKEGDRVQVVVEASGNNYMGFAVLDPEEKIIALYPHVSAGSRAHWNRVAKISLLFAVGFSLLGISVFSFLYHNSGAHNIILLYKIFGAVILGSFLMFGVIGYRVGSRFSSFTRMANLIFKSLNWEGAGKIDLRKITRIKRKPSDPPAMGDSYFRY